MGRCERVLRFMSCEVKKEIKIQNESCQMTGREVTRLLLLQENERSRSYREINQRPSLPWNFITHGFLYTSAFPDKRWFWQMFPFTKISSKQSFPAVLPWKKKAMIFDIPGPQRPERGHIRQNHPFTKPPICLLSTGPRLACKNNVCVFLMASSWFFRGPCPAFPESRLLRRALLQILDQLLSMLPEAVQVALGCHARDLRELT